MAALKLAIRINSNGIKNIAAADRVRANALLQANGSSSIDVTNSVVFYLADVGVGSPPTYYSLVVDTGSSNTWIGADKTYTKTSSSQDTGGQFNVASTRNPDPIYVHGEQYLDTITLNSDLVIQKQSIGVTLNTTEMREMDSLDGTLGLGPVDLTRGTVSNVDEVPTVMNNLYAQKKISSEVLGVFFSPVSPGNISGELTFGGYDASKITGSISYVPITTTSPANKYWGINQSISYGTTSILNETAGIVDSGTLLILIATDAFNKYVSETGATHDETTGLLKISPDQYNKLSSLYFTIGGVSYEVTPNAQIWPRSLNTEIGGTADAIYLIVGDIKKESSTTGLGFINGFCFLERFYSVLDKTNSRVGFAKTEYTYATSN